MPDVTDSAVATVVCASGLGLDIFCLATALERFVGTTSFFTKSSTSRCFSRCSCILPVFRSPKGPSVGSALSADRSSFPSL